jgi:hypothetical protein
MRTGQGKRALVILCDRSSVNRASKESEKQASMDKVKASAGSLELPAGDLYQKENDRYRA